jgi:hypothetical protein
MPAIPVICRTKIESSLSEVIFLVKIERQLLVDMNK